MPKSFFWRNWRFHIWRKCFSYYPKIIKNELGIYPMRLTICNFTITSPAYECIVMVNNILILYSILAHICKNKEWHTIRFYFILLLLQYTYVGYPPFVPRIRWLRLVLSLHCMTKDTDQHVSGCKWLNSMLNVSTVRLCNGNSTQ